MPRVQLASLGPGVSVRAGAGALILAPRVPGTITVHGTDAPLPVYARESGGSADSSGAFVTDEYGRIPGWADSAFFGQAVDVHIPPADPVTVLLGGPAGPTGSRGPVGPTGPLGLTGPPGVGANWQGVWAGGTTYATGDGVAGSDLQTYISNVNANTGHDPTTDDGTHWSKIPPVLPFIDVWGSHANPTGVTDWGPTVNAIIAGGAHRLYFGPHDFPFSTQLNLANTQGIVFEGSGGAQGIVLASISPTRLIWTGVGAGSPITLVGNNGFYGCDFGIFYNNSGFTGKLWDNDTAYATLLDRCRIGSIGYRFTALACVGMHKAVNCTLRDCAIGGDQPGTGVIGGAQYDILGIEVAGQFSNVVRIDNCILGRATIAQVANPYQDWKAKDVTWELFDTPRALTTTGLGIAGNLTIDGGWLGDSTAVTEPIYLPAADSWTIVIRGLFGAPPNVPMLKILGGGYLTVEDCPWQRGDSGALIDLGDTTAGAVAKTVWVRGINSSTNVEAILNRAGHRLNVVGMGESCKTVERQNLGGHENVTWKTSDPCVPAMVANAALGTGAGVAFHGSDRAGMFYLSPGTGPTAGSLVTMTFGTPYESDPTNNQASPYGADIPLVFLSPIDWGGLGRGAIGNYYNAQVGVKYTGNNKDAVDIECNVAPAGAIACAYRVVEL